MEAGDILTKEEADAMNRYRRLHDVLSELIEGGTLSVGDGEYDIPQETYQEIVDILTANANQ